MIKVNVVGKVRFVPDVSVFDLFTGSVCTVGTGEVPPPTYFLTAFPAEGIGIF